MTKYFFQDISARYENGSLYVRDRFISEFSSLSEAREYVESLREANEIRERERKKLLEEATSDKRIAIALYESGEKRVTESLINGIRSIIENKIFYPSEVVLDVRTKLIESNIPAGKIDYKLNDGSVILIDIETNQFINSLIELRESTDLLKFMNSNKSNFMKCINDLLEDN